MLRLALVVVPLIAFAGCQKENPDYCPMHPGQQGCPDAASGGPCKSNPDCTSTPGFPVCDTTDNGGTCVLCTANDHALCTGTTPICDNHNCVACTLDGDCGTGGLCLPNGACATSDNIIHAVSTNGLTSNCGGPGANACTLTTAFAAVTATKNVIKLDDSGTYSPDAQGPSGVNGFVASNDVTIIAGAATLHSKGDDPILSNNNSAKVTIIGGTIEGATGPTSDGIQCNSNATLSVSGTIIKMNERFGINAGACTLTLAQSHLTMNKGGGINIQTGKFIIVGNAILNNGDANSSNGGVTINTGLDAKNRMEFNTIANNTSQGGAIAGVDCKAGVGFSSHDNIIWGNSDPLQITGSCLHTYSVISGTIIVPGIGNRNDDPHLTSDGHLGPGSSALRNADSMADLTGIASKDFDGDMRVMPADIGADQVPR